MPSISRVLRFFLAGGGSLSLDLLLQGVFLQLVGLPVWLASGLSYELAMLAHFGVNDRWVFGRRDDGRGGVLRRLVAFQLAGLTAMGVTYGVTNLLVYGPTAPFFVEGAGPYVAKALGTALATVWTFCSSFFWIWRDRTPDPPDQTSASRASSAA
jgi:putative flippase GtrA